MDRLRRVDVGGVIIGLVILGVGIYYLLVNTFGIALPELNWDMIWPIALIAVGIGVVTSAWSRRTHGQEGPRGV